MSATRSVPNMRANLDSSTPSKSDPRFSVGHDALGRPLDAKRDRKLIARAQAQESVVWLLMGVLMVGFYAIGFV